MTAYGVADLVVLALDSTGAVDERADGSATTAELSETIAFGESLADRVQLLAALSSLTRSGLVEESIDETDRTRYRLTDAGHDRAAELRAELTDERVTVFDGTDTVECDLCDVPEAVDISVAQALVRRSPSGELLLEDAFDDVVDRETVFDRLTAAFESLTTVDPTATVETDAGQPTTDTTQTIVVTGDAGVGKTTVVETFLDRVRERCADVFVGRSRPGGDAPFEPIEAALDAGDATTPAFDVDTVLETPDAETYRAHRTRLYGDVASWLETRAADAPVVLVVEDLQWADSATLDLLAHLHSSLAPAPVLLLCTYRGDGVDDADPLEERVGPDADEPTVLPLSPFDRETTATLVEHELGRRGVPAAFTDAVYTVTGGNPLFVVETVAAALEDGALDPRVDRYPTSTDALSAPGVVETTIRRRFDRLDDETRELVDVGALVDEPITVETLGALCALSPARLRDRVDLLVDAGIWRETDGGYRFRSDVLRSGARSALDADRRRERHGEIATLLAADDDPNHARIATHFDRADEAAAALEQYRLAAADAEATYAHDVAAAHYERALSIARDLDRDDDALALLESLGDSHYTRGEFDAADRYFRYVREATDEPDRIRRSYYYQARMHFEQSEYEQTKTFARRGLDVGGDEVTEAVCWLVDYLGSAHMKCGEHEAAREYFRTQRSYADSIDFDLSLGRSYQNLGNVAHNVGSVEEAVDLAERGAEILETVSAERELARCLNDLAIVYSSAGRNEAAAETFRRAHELAERTGNVRARILATNNLGTILQKEGNWSAAKRRYREVTDLADRAGDTNATALARWNASLIELSLGDLPAAIDGLERALATVDDAENVKNRVHYYTNLAWAYLLAERFDSAYRYVATGQRLAAEHDFVRLRITGAAYAGVIARMRGDVETAVEQQEQARARLESTDDVIAEWFLLDHLSRTYVAAGEPSRALDCARTAHERMPDGNPQETIRVDVSLGAALRAAGDAEAARDRLESALADASDLSALAEIRARRELARLERDEGNVDRAREHYEAGIELAASAGMTLYETQLSDEAALLDADVTVTDGE
ncbi:adenylyl cyclase class-3/4/guanylyl cyclase [Halovivax asiaticus JCM 14624]|uniref:Adenylyl cyclase class-3/4/guanylyl cyclase n=1 Tax=Halovivax asiaticus JCM 14624 TaxID=1227490 RepID=M0BPU9_9EURY|nr:tetratricopeptide repeat protein [Halovivax asiaticus]ELZ11624.1 adenylyl cyclase class-3/4/guanylyl cyclase [Halovivax asiaticus JCM 14624]